MFSELYKILVNKVTFVGFTGGRSPKSLPPGSALALRCSKFAYRCTEKFVIVWI